MMAFAMVVLLSMSALAIDLAFLYVGRSEAQRAADAAALAGAKQFVDSGFTSGVITQSAVQPLATQAAEAVGSQNFVGGQPAVILDSDVTFDFSIANDPRITVTVARDTAHANPMPTFFAKAFGVKSANVSAKATAEAYNPSGSTNGPTICAKCIKPFLLPNCDPVHTSPPNPLCNGSAGYFIDPNTGAIQHPGPASSGGEFGQTWLLHSQTQPKVPSQWFLVDVGCGNGNQVPCIEGCTSAAYACGDQLTTVPGKRVGQMEHGINTLIHASGDGPGQGQDTIDLSSGPPFKITGGSGNPNPAMVGKPIANSSSSLITVPIYDGHGLHPGHDTVTIIGYMQMFVQYIEHKGPSDDITATILNVTGCGIRQGQCGTPTTISGGGGTLIPIRLVRNPGT